MPADRECQRTLSGVHMYRERTYGLNKIIACVCGHKPADAELPMVKAQLAETAKVRRNRGIIDAR